MRAASHSSHQRTLWLTAQFLLIQTAEAEVFHLEKFVDAIMRSFTTKSGLFHAAEGSDLVGDQPGVNAHHSVFERLGHSPDPTHVAAKKIAGETELGIVRQLNRFFILVKPEKWSHGTERFFPGYLHLGRHIREHRRL